MRILAIICIIAAVICEDALADIDPKAFLPMTPTAKPVLKKRTIVNVRAASVTTSPIQQASISLGQPEYSASVHVDKPQTEREEPHQVTKRITTETVHEHTAKRDDDQVTLACESRIFLLGFTAYQNHEYNKAVTSLNDLLQKYPGTLLRDLALFWLARSHYKANSYQVAARYMAQFNREYPGHHLKNNVEEELLALSARYD